MPGLLALQRLAGNRAVTAVVQRSVTAEKFNIVGENHRESDSTRAIDEKRYAREKFGLEYWDEKEFSHESARGDSFYYSAIQDVVYIHNLARAAREYATVAMDPTTDQERVQQLLKEIPGLLDNCSKFAMDLYKTRAEIAKESPALAAACKPLPSLANSIKYAAGSFLHSAPDAAPRLKKLINCVPELMAAAEEAVRGVDGIPEALDSGETQDPWAELEVAVSEYRGEHMLQTANKAAVAGITGLWKVGDDHIAEMRAYVEEEESRDVGVVLTDRNEFNAEFGAWVSEQPGARP